MRSVVVTRYGLHALIESHHEHHENESYSVGYAIGTNGQVTAVAHQLIVDEYYHYASANIHEERGHAYGEDVFHQGGFQFVDALFQVKQLFVV